MRPPAEYTEQQWRALLTDLDARLVAAARAYMRRRFLWETDIAIGYSELGKLRRSGEPDYDAPGLSVAYAFAYLPRRVACLLGALTLIANRGVPRRVLDIGSGSDAALLALDLWAPGSEIEVISVEPSREMRGFAAELCYGPGVKREWLPIGLDDIVDGCPTLQVQDFDLVIMSACLPYGGQRWNQMARQIGGLTRPPAAVLIIEPSVKAPHLLSLADGLEQTGWLHVERRCCHDLPRVVHTLQTMPAATEMLSELYPGLLRNIRLSRNAREFLGEPMYTVRSWNANRNYRELIALGVEG